MLKKYYHSFDLDDVGVEYCLWNDEMYCDEVIDGKCYIDTAKTVQRMINGTLDEKYK